MWALITSGSSYDQIGSGGLTAAAAQNSAGRARHRDPADASRHGTAIRAARGEEAHDVDAELLRTHRQRPRIPGLRNEVRSLVEATNARRAARGQEPLDVEAEIDRRLRELG